MFVNTVDEGSIKIEKKSRWTVLALALFHSFLDARFHRSFHGLLMPRPEKSSGTLPTEALVLEARPFLTERFIADTDIPKWLTALATTKSILSHNHSRVI
jgi:hypothetical protein